MNNFKNITVSCAVGAALVGCVATPNNTSTPLELRMLQTRKFNKPPREIIDAIKTNCEDYGGQASMSMPFNLPDLDTTGTVKGATQKVVNKDISMNGTGVCQMPMNMDATAGGKVFIPYIGGFLAMAELQDAMKSAGRMNYEVKTDPQMTVTTVRMRIYTRRGEQMTDAKIYSEWFSKIGDAVHIQAIKIDPASQE